jgi:hypothetical protein
MELITKTLLVLSAVGFAVSSPPDFDSLKNDITAAADTNADYRLPKNVLPLSYELEIKPHFINVSILEAI